MATILVVDDDPDFVLNVRLWLERAGHTVFSAANPAEGMRALKRQQPELLILDVIMESPDDGIVMAQQLRRAGDKIPILMLTSLPSVAGMSFARDDEMIPVDEFVEKPVAPTRLLELVDRLLGARG